MSTKLTLSDLAGANIDLRLTKRDIIELMLQEAETRIEENVVITAEKAQETHKALHETLAEISEKFSHKILGKKDLKTFLESASKLTGREHILKTNSLYKVYTDKTDFTYRISITLMCTEKLSASSHPRGLYLMQFYHEDFDLSKNKKFMAAFEKNEAAILARTEACKTQQEYQNQSKKLRLSLMREIFSTTPEGQNILAAIDDLVKKRGIKKLTK